jgi:hypothetical protein
VAPSPRGAAPAARVAAQPSPVWQKVATRIQRVTHGTNGAFSDARKATVQKAGEIAEKVIASAGFKKKWETFWKGRGKDINPKPTLAQYQAAVRGRVIHDMDGSTNADVQKLVQDEKGKPTEGLNGQTAAATAKSSSDTYVRRFAVDQGLHSLVNLILHESLHGAGLSEGPGSLPLYEPLFHEFEAEANFPMMMGGADILDIQQVQKGKTGVDVTIKYRIRKLAGEPLPSSIFIEIVATGTGEKATEQSFEEYKDYQGGRTIFKEVSESVPSKAGDARWTWHASNPGWDSYSVRLIDKSKAFPVLMGEKEFKTNPLWPKDAA